MMNKIDRWLDRIADELRFPLLNAPDADDNEYPLGVGA